MTNRAHVSVSSGQRLEHILATDADSRLTWFFGSADVAVGRSWMLLGSVERSQGETEKTTQIHASAGWRF